MTLHETRLSEAKRRAKSKRKRIIVGFLILAMVLLIGTGIYFFRDALPFVDRGAKSYETFKTVLPPKQLSLHMTAIGDSLTMGVGDANEEGYAGRTADKLKHSDWVSRLSFKDYGVKGDTTDDLLKVLRRNDVQEDIRNSDIILMTIGGNDLVNVLKRNLTTVQLDDFENRRVAYLKNLNKILKTIRDLNDRATLYYIGLYNPFEDLFPELNDQIEAIINEWNQGSKTVLELYPNTVFIPTYDLFKGKVPDVLSDDHFHPNAEGYQLIADRLAKVIEKK